MDFWKQFIDPTSPYFYATLGAAALLLLALILTLHFTVFSHARLRKSLGEMEKQFSYLNALLLGQDAQLLQRLDTIASSNLIYSETYNAFNARFNNLRDGENAEATRAMREARSCEEKHDYRGLKKALAALKASLEAFKASALAYDKELQDVIAPSEEGNQDILPRKEALRLLKSDFYAKQSDLTLVAASFEKTFELLEGEFAEYQRLVDGANYEKAKAKLPFFDSLLKALRNALEAMPDLCAQISVLIPSRISSIRNRMEEMQRKDYALSHITTSAYLDDMNARLREISASLQAFRLEGIPAELDAMMATLEEDASRFDAEESSRGQFEAEYETVYRKEGDLESRYVSLSNALPSIKAVYLVSPAEQEKIDAVASSIEDCAAAKRALDSLTASGIRQPFTLLLSRVEALKEAEGKCETAFEEWTSFMARLKEDVNEASAALPQYDESVHECELTLAAMAVPSLSERYAPKVEECFALIDEVYASLQTPIDVASLNELLNRLRVAGDALRRELSSYAAQLQQADAKLVFANRGRKELSELRVLCEQAEGLYWQADFANAAQTAQAAISKTPSRKD